MAPLSIGRAWDEAKAALTANRRLIVPVALGMVLLPAVIVSMVQPQMPAGQQPPPGAWMLVGLTMLIVMLIGEIAIVLLVNGWRGSVGEAIGKATRRVPTLILAALAFMVPAILILSVLLAVMGVVRGSDGNFNPASVSAAGWMVILLCLVSLVVISVRLLPLMAVVACEEVGPIASLRRVFTLTSGQFWRLLGFLLLLFVAFVIVTLTVGSVVGGLVTVAFGRPEPWSISLVLIALAGGLVQAAFVMVYTAMLARIYVQLNAARPGVPDVAREG